MVTVLVTEFMRTVNGTLELQYETYQHAAALYSQYSAEINWVQCWGGQYSKI